MTQTTYLQAITTTLAEAMRADPRVLVLGEDVAEGGPWGATAGLVDEFGPERVRNTPISEAAICGVAIGLAQSGLRPVVEIMFADFPGVCFDQIVNSIAVGVGSARRSGPRPRCAIHAARQHDKRTYPPIMPHRGNRAR